MSSKYSLAIVVNSCALGPRAPFVTGSRTTTPHIMREHALRNFILPAYARSPHVAEVVVAGEWERGDGYTYVHSPSREFSCVDALDQRHAGFLETTADLVAFTHDDHFLDPKALEAIATHGLGSADVLVPRRLARTREGIVLLNNGGGDRDPYIGGHAEIMRREVAVAAPWNAVNRVHTWDLSHTQNVRAAGARIEWSVLLDVWDVEPGVTHR